VLVMSKASVVDSVACKREYQYAAALQKPILPVLVADDVSTSLLPSELHKIQFVDYKLRDINSIKSLARALGALPLGHQLPNPLPPAPEPPISYLASLSNQIDLASFLDLEAQSRILIELKSSLRDPATSLDSELLLKRLRARNDLFAKIAEDIDQVLVPAPTARRFLAAPQTVRQKPVIAPLTDAAEREKIARLRIWVQWLLWATPFTAVFSAHLSKEWGLQLLSFFYFVVGCGLLIFSIAGLPVKLAIIVASIIFLVGTRVRRLSHQSHATLQCNQASYFVISVASALLTYVLPFHYIQTELFCLPPISFSCFIIGASLTHWKVLLSRQEHA
jgi:hypothetical protein